MSTSSIGYVDAKARVVRSINRVTAFVRASMEFNDDRLNVEKRAKIKKMLSELNNIRQCVEEDVQIMETAVGSKTAPPEVIDNSSSNSLLDSFDSLYYDLAAFADVNQMLLSSQMDVSQRTNQNTIPVGDITNSYIQYPKRKFPTFSGIMKDWQGFEQLFLSILSHTPDLPAVEQFEILKTSLEGEARTLISHLPLTAANYHSAWEILRARYGNKRDLARIHLEPLLSSHIVKSNDANSIKNQLNCILEHTSALDNLDFVTRQWSPILIHIFEKHLDCELRSRWESTVGENHCPKLTEFVDFLRRQIRTAEIHSSISSSSTSTTIQPKYTSRPNAHNIKYLNRPSAKILTATTNQTPVVKCPLCQHQHSIRKCPVFNEKLANERFQLAKTHQLCINCLGPGHSIISCPSKYKCQKCNRSHHTMLHFDSPSSTSQAANTVQVDRLVVEDIIPSLVVKGQPQSVVLLSTILLDVRANDGSLYSLRALLDSGSQASFITDESASRLMLRRYPSSVNVTTFASTTSTLVRGKSTITITPCGQSNPSFLVDTFIVPTITGQTPQIPIVPGKWSHLRNLLLADPSYHTPSEIDLLLGADILPSLLLDGKINGQIGEPIALETVFGWILMGPVNSSDSPSVTSLCMSVTEKLDETLKQFWEMEELPRICHLSSDDIAAENFYKTTTTRLNTGRFMVKIPFKLPLPLLGDSKTIALQRFKALEVRLSRDVELGQQYADFMREYLDAGHMELIPSKDRDTTLNYYIPHHCVLRPDSKTTKLRVVFNASARTTAGTSLNESMYVGPKLQPDIQAVLLRARLWKYLFLADIKQMYRQILVHPDDRDYQRILWRCTTKLPIDEYRLCTVTYGTSAAPYQALRTLRELALQDGDKWPKAAATLLTDTFVDDILTGANTEEAALECQSQLIHLCSSAQFELHKWASNNPKILLAIPETDRAMSPSIFLDDSENPMMRILGLKWDPLTDTFSYHTLKSSTAPTKRSVLSDIARVFDPLGLLSPTTLWTKYFMQRLWTSGINWDDLVPVDLIDSWTRYQSEIHLIENLSIPRRLTIDSSSCIQLHAFADSSEKGYAAAVYLRVSTATTVQCNLVTGKSKVAPLKRVTIPRLELCGAVLAAKLLRFVATTYQDRLHVDQLYAWTDSTTVLVWIRSSPHRWATFIANRTSQIQDLTSPSIWNHVPTHFNPVDCASRGLFPSDLINHPLWWTGPPFLLEPSENWPKLPELRHEDANILPEFEPKRATVLLVSVNSPLADLLDRFSSLDKILRIVSYCLRFFKPQSSIPLSTSVTAPELSHSLNVLISFTQHMVYSEDIKRLKKGMKISKELGRLDLFIDPAGLVRVGGRLTHADLPYAHKHPVLLPSSHRLTALIILHHHHRLKHPGAQALQTYLQQQYWIQSARRSIRSHLRLCIPCFRTRPKCIEPKMAVLPKYRVQQIKPFAITGVDYAGPITIRRSRGRSDVSMSAYICLFVCTTTKALHLELSSDLTTETFLLAFTRFVARRGPIQEMHSDCGTNFIGAARLLTPLDTFTQSKQFQNRIHEKLAQTNISWYFNPPSSPHFGGLWEAGVKSTKSLILRSIGLHRLTSEELLTLLTQIEATLNSRPLSALSNDPKDLTALTPSHFLTLQPSTLLPEPNLEAIPMSKLQRWRLINDIHRHFWARWKSEYLSSLQIRSKWTENGKKVSIGDLVVIKEATRPLHWPLGRIIQLHPGSDGISRVATVQTASGLLKRPSVKLCPLPIY